MIYEYIATKLLIWYDVDINFIYTIFIFERVGLE